jgi:hypothetical protein
MLGIYYQSQEEISLHCGAASESFLSSQLGLITGTSSLGWRLTVNDFEAVTHIQYLLNIICCLGRTFHTDHSILNILNQSCEFRHDFDVGHVRVTPYLGIFIIWDSGMDSLAMFFMDSSKSIPNDAVLKPVKINHVSGEHIFPQQRVGLV